MGSKKSTSISKYHGTGMGIIILAALFSFSLSAILPAAVFGGTGLASNFKIEVTMVNHEPDPAEPGRYVTVRFKVENDGRENAEDIILELLPEYPFSLDPGESPVKKIGSVYGKQIGKIGVIVDYRLRVDERAGEGDTDLELKYKINDGVWILLEPFTVEIKPSSAILRAVRAFTLPDVLEQGRKGTLHIDLENLALSFIKDVKVKVKLDGLPLATVGSTNEKVVKLIGAGNVSRVSFDVVPQPEAASGLYNVPLEISFLDRLGTSYKKNESVGVMVGEQPELLVSLESSAAYTRGQAGKISVKFVNKGITDIKFLQAALSESKEYRVLSSPNVYVGNIDSDDYETAEYTIALGKVSGDEVLLPVTVQYRDATNREYQKTVQVSLPLFSEDDAKKLGIQQKGSGAWVLVVVVLAGGLAYWYFRAKRRRKRAAL
ncbi:hypothetical protein HYV84_02600 [Candidatus Woesearchaeota archaeon]|nr:hypothetical protein [Candidatus Woesearchaeota archaeon]